MQQPKLLPKLSSEEIQICSLLSSLVKRSRRNNFCDEPFILATQAEQVCYVKDPLDPDWEVVMKLTARESFDAEPQDEPLNQQHLDEIICENTDVPLNYQGRCLHSVGLWWREWKYHVKRDNYDIYTTDEERLAIVPDRVIAGQWRTLVQYWGQEAVKVVSKQNSINCEHLGGYHKMGRSSFRSVRLEYRCGVEVGDDDGSCVSCWGPAEHLQAPANTYNATMHARPTTAAYTSSATSIWPTSSPCNNVDNTSRDLQGCRSTSSPPPLASRR
ncbi:hypothetical protein KSP40_PGU019564 [Platanthera guangdongensis]|uniref:DUF4216 domain-containing protein n=1 Tax=Platanthera guangdongensis TaxID=2320717 RepID=A0ABR2M5V2_9ASPA